MQNHAPTIYAFASLQALFDGEAAGVAKAASPGESLLERSNRGRSLSGCAAHFHFETMSRH
jgi:hypothetical protein